MSPINSADACGHRAVKTSIAVLCARLVSATPTVLTCFFAALKSAVVIFICHLSPFAFRCSLRRASDVERLSEPKIILKRISGKDQENFSETSVSPTKTQGKIIERIFSRLPFFRRFDSNRRRQRRILARDPRCFPIQDRR
jgi:hypothetical protein